MKLYYLTLFFLIGVCSACTRKWTEKDKSEFVSGCLSNAVRDTTVGERYAKPFCLCLVDKIVEKYPNANDAKYIKYDSAIIQIRKDCEEKAKAD